MINIESLIKTLGENKVKVHEPMSLHTTLRIGGPADILYEACDSGDLIKAVRLARSFEVPVTVIGGGSNILVSDLGIRGLVIKNVGGGIKIVNDKDIKGRILNYLMDSRLHRNDKIRSTIARWMGAKSGTQKYDFADLDYDESNDSEIEVSLSAGVNLQYAITNLLDRGITGLQWYGRIPGTIGGAVYNNIHGGSHIFSEVVKNVVVLDELGEVRTVFGPDLKFEYDKSRFHKNKEIILEVTLVLRKGNVERARRTLVEWTKRKSCQPMNSAGCVFKNIPEHEREIFGYPTNATGYIVEHVLNMTGFSVGGAAISVDHHNFIVNIGGATANDYVAVRDAIAQKAVDVLGITLEDEIIFLGEFGNLENKIKNIREKRK